MICSIVKWLVSRELDGGAALPPFARRHLARCGACRRFEAFAGSLDEGLSMSASEAFRPALPLPERGLPGYVLAAAAVVAAVAIGWALVQMKDAGSPRSTVPAATVAGGVAPGGQNLPAPVVSLDRLSMVAWDAMPALQINREIDCLESDTALAAESLFSAFGLP
jgi:hypothetical protein